MGSRREPADGIQVTERKGLGRNQVFSGGQAESLAVGDGYAGTSWPKELSGWLSSYLSLFESLSNVVKSVNTACERQIQVFAPHFQTHRM